MTKGSLKILIGAAPGVGKTYAMLREGHRLVRDGSDVVIAYLETHGRKATEEEAHGFESIPPRLMTYRHLHVQEMDLAATLRRHPEVALVDELAHTNVSDCVHDKRWQDVQDILDAGIDVITTINVQHIESLNDVVRAITGSLQKETVPDTFLRTADQIEVVDIPPQILRERLSAGLVYAPNRVDAALSNYFRLGNLTALRELALLWLAGNVDESLRQYREQQGINDKWETRERVVVALSGGPEGEALLRRGARVAARSGGGELLAVHVTSSDGLRSGQVRLLTQQRALVEKLGGTFHQVVGEDIVDSIVEFAEAVNATQIVIGVSSRSSLRRYFGCPSVSENLVQHCGSIDVHLVTHDFAAQGFTLPKIHGVLPPKRKLFGLLFCAIAIPLLTVALMPGHDEYSLPRNILSYQLIVVIAAMIGGAIPAVAAALVSGAIIDLFFIAPIGTFHMYEQFGVISLLLYVVIALLVSYVVDHAERRSHAAQRARAESELLSSISGSVLRSHDPLRALVDRAREAFGFSRVTLRQEDGTIVQSVSEPAPGQQEGHGDSSGGPAAEQSACAHADGGAERRAVDAGDGNGPHYDVDDGIKDVSDDDDDHLMVYELNGGKATLTAEGAEITANDQRLFNTVLTQVQTVLEHKDLERKASRIEPLTAADRIRSALLDALSHDLRRPLASATAAVSGLMGNYDHLDESDRDDLLQVASRSLEELTKLVTDLLDVSRLREDALPISLCATDSESVIVGALDELDMGPDKVSLDIHESPLVCADPPLLRRSISNLLLNASRFNPPNRKIGISISAFRERVEIRIIDYGPGIAPQRKEKIFVPFQRLGDTDNTTGLGLGLALSKGFVEGMGGRLIAEDTPGGGLTMVISLRALGPDAVVGSPISLPPGQIDDSDVNVDQLIDTSTAADPMQEEDSQSREKGEE
ncbi:osmosensitive K+ channel histidine kinase [Bifidobacterium minimum]|uniref:histidine kinase n=1 Tax=Bifidobacterium minimum TaxID=1693 RepID=A0A087BPT7_9BIFI|nr:ATP-binding protein [Bifidobacterium minimum]KFI73037.1 osmosensitive K+ channel histidine kinase [Bifidobacterium minimum]